MADHRDVVVVGASAGGVEALLGVNMIVHDVTEARRRQDDLGHANQQLDALGSEGKAGEADGRAG